MTRHHWQRCSLIFVTIVVFSQLVFTISQGLAFNHSLSHALSQIETRVALDSTYLDLGDPATQQTVNSELIEDYISALNLYISEQLEIKDFTVESISFEYSPSTLSGARLDIDGVISRMFAPNPIRVLNTGNFDMYIRTSLPALKDQFRVNWFGLLLGIVVVLFITKKVEAKQLRQQTRESAIPSANLRIDLHQKRLVNLATNEFVDMQNKPLCFFTALVEYCIKHPNQELLHHKDVPQELTTYANKAFGRLIELGHTKRKRPDFNANLEKTLSEIRAVLDMVFTQNEPAKKYFYPPRAQGEGSRSKQHSYALNLIERQHIEVLGM